MGCLRDPANVQQTSSKCIQNTRAKFAGRLLDSVNTLSVTDQNSTNIRALFRVIKKPMIVQLYLPLIV